MVDVGINSVILEHESQDKRNRLETSDTLAQLYPHEAS